MTSENSTPTLRSILPAAGLSTRMGSSKASLPIGGETFLTRILRMHLELELNPAVVLNGTDPQALRAVRDAAAPLFINSTPERGPLSSIRLALGHLIGKSTGVLIHPVDHPLVSKQSLRMMIEAHIESPDQIIQPICQGRKGHPVLFPAKLFRELQEAPLDEGARWVVRRHKKTILTTPVEDRGIHRNIDTPQAYRRWVGELPSRSGSPESRSPEASG